MRDITGLIGRDALVEKAAQEVRKDRHVILTGKVGVGKSSVLEHCLQVRDFEKLSSPFVGLGFD